MENYTRKSFKILAKKILEESKSEGDGPKENDSLESWINYALKKYHEMQDNEHLQEYLNEQLSNLIITELFYSFNESSLNKIINKILHEREREDRVHLDYDLSDEQAEIIGKIISQRLSSVQREYFLKTLIDTKNTKKTPLRPYRKPSINTCPVCNSSKFKNVKSTFLDKETFSKKVCERCGYIHKIKKSERKINYY